MWSLASAAEPTGVPLMRPSSSLTFRQPFDGEPDQVQALPLAFILQKVKTHGGGCQAGPVGRKENDGRMYRRGQRT